jgi:hypothetical protein
MHLLNYLFLYASGFEWYLEHGRIFLGLSAGCMQSVSIPRFLAFCHHNGSAYNLKWIIDLSLLF